MKIGFSSGKTSFGRALSTREEREFTKTAKDAKKTLGIEDGRTILKIYVPSLPQKSEIDTGSGKLCSDEALNFIRTLNVYTDADVDKMMPDGKLDKVERGYIPYLRGSLTLGEDGINLALLANDEIWGGIVDNNDLKLLVESNRKSYKPNWINYENELGRTMDYPILGILHKAYEKVMNPENPAVISIAERFEEYKKKPVNKFYDRIALVPLIVEGKLPKDFFKNIDKSPEKLETFEKLKKQYSTEIDFFKFCQFVALEQHNDARKALNADGKELWGDCQITFGDYEVLAYPEAFIEGASVGWGLPVLNVDELLNEKSSAHKLFKQKVQFFLENYDGIRFDVGWSYINPVIQYDDGRVERRDFKDSLLNFIDETARNIKGADFDTGKLVYEADAGAEDFSYIDGNTKKVKPFLKNHTLVLTSQYQNLHGWDGLGWNNPSFFEKIGMSQKDYTLGHNHDVSNLRRLAIDDLSQVKADNVEVLSKLLNIPKAKVSNPVDFVKAKFAELFLTKNRYMMFYDVLGRTDILDAQTENPDEYRMRIDTNWERDFHSALQNNHGFNLMESLSMAMKAKGLDVKYPDIYDRVEYFSKLLREDGVKTKRDADIAESMKTLDSVV